MSEDEVRGEEFATALDRREEPPVRGFAIPAHPTRRYLPGGGLSYEGETVFTLSPDPPRDDGTLVSLVEGVLSGEAYRYGDWVDLPMPLYLVHDDETGDTFRVTVRDGTVEFHVLPETEPAGLRALYERLDGASDCDWTVDRHVSARPGPGET